MPETERNKNRIRAAALEALALRARAAYVRLRSRHDRDVFACRAPYRVPARHDGARGSGSAWLALARFLAARGVEPEPFLRAQFEGPLTHARRAPEPDRLRTACCLEIHADAERAADRTVRIARQTQNALYRGRVAEILRDGDRPPRLAAATVLTDLSLGLSPLFRYCLAVRLGGPDFARIARTCEEAASRQYLYGGHAYDRHWGDLLPPGFAGHARAVVEYLAREEAAADNFRVVA